MLLIPFDFKRLLFPNIRIVFAWPRPPNPPLPKAKICHLQGLQMAPPSGGATSHLTDSIYLIVGSDFNKLDVCGASTAKYY